MTNYRPFVAFFPRTIEVGDKVILKGKIRDNASKFSVNFTYDCAPVPAYVAYHFKTDFTKDKSEGVVHNYKFNVWAEEQVEEQTWCEKPGDHFHLEFIFQEEAIYVYTESGFQYKYMHQLDMDRIKTVQIWDDLEYLDMIAFDYSQNR